MSDFATSIERLLTQVRHWEESRWSARAGAESAAGGDSASKADQAFALVQRLADLDAEAAGRAPREVPRLHDLVLPDQLRVVSDDLLAASPGPELLTIATAAVDEFRRIV
ncbi:hypothetical protein ACWT_0830 [Actinoplanes sp. SE50]|uniref:hypothetical protein n=1 Tax=unclassified Actinoplanes TaxID=2626549 RepID=UPI00023EC03E|nr:MULTISPECIES: hypothetical protein [unclassified Actinoplanes]AEV81844.1 hypothetical protein ACPL_947 [Actinoplanes sp. SE50/110]ATO80245.1 hypothetical protein ACWT_0830 [Actinoplanes sp. SE50]SLL97650.1 hypothetical protein ACSP50_0858 [Actinoplanes sp. SE50/110]